MSAIWNFTPSLEPQVQLCIAAASNNEQNKWLRHFGHLKFGNLTPTQESTSRVNNCENIKKTDSPVILIDSEDCNENAIEQNITKSSDIESENLEIINDVIESDISSKFDYITAQSVKNHTFLQALANHLPVSSIEKLCHVFNSNTNISKQFISIFFKIFLPAVIKRDYNSTFFDLLLKGLKTYPQEAKTVISSIIKDLHIPNKVLQDYISTLTLNDKETFLLTLSNLELTKEEFTHNLFTIFTAYRDCTKTDEIQTFVQTMVNQYHVYCVSDKNFGRLLLTYFQSFKGKEFQDYSTLEMIVQSHRSPFKRPCLNVINELKDRGKYKPQCEDDSETEDN